MTVEGAIAATRFGLGAQPGEIERASQSPQAWLRGQLTLRSAISPKFKGLISSADAIRITKTYRQDRKMMSESDKTFTAKRFNQTVRSTYQSEVLARARHGAGTDASFHERLTRFWSNHFSVSTRSPDSKLLAGTHEREAIRPYILGNFVDLAAKAILHPAMLIYLDNSKSVGPNSRAGLMREKGLNENLARETLELHTITPAAGYTQADVTEFAKALTGWTIDQGSIKSPSFGTAIFNRRKHEPGHRRVLGRKYSKRGKNQARAILADICIRPETAENIAVKLATHFVSDNPPASLVKALKQSFLQSRGDLMELYNTLITAPEAWVTNARKVKTPEELLISTARMVGFKSVFQMRSTESYDSLSQRPFNAPTPEGWPDVASAWISPDSIMKRVEWANELASRLSSVDARQFLQSALGARASEDTARAISRAQSGQEALALALMSPDFQRR